MALLRAQTMGVAEIVGQERFNFNIRTIRIHVNEGVLKVGCEKLST